MKKSTIFGIVGLLFGAAQFIFEILSGRAAEKELEKHNKELCSNIEQTCENYGLKRKEK